MNALDLNKKRKKNIIPELNQSDLEFDDTNNSYYRKNQDTLTFDDDVTKTPQQISKNQYKAQYPLESIGANPEYFRELESKYNESIRIL